MKYSLGLYVVACTLSLGIGLYSLHRRSVSLSGLVALVVISFSLIWLDAIALLLVMFYMFASSSLLSSFHKRQKHELEKVLSKSGPRDYVQALANLGNAFLFILLYILSGDVIWVIATIGSVAAGNSDSWASEIGAMSRQTPISILNAKPLPVGISGGITVRGTLAGFFGSLFIAALSIFTLKTLDTVSFPLFPTLISTCVAGFSGMLFDSFLGALFQALYQEPHSQLLTENAEGNSLVKGSTWMNNDMVNFLSTLFGGLGAIVLYWMLS